MFAISNVNKATQSAKLIAVFFGIFLLFNLRTPAMSFIVPNGGQISIIFVVLIVVTFFAKSKGVMTLSPSATIVIGLLSIVFLFSLISTAVSLEAYLSLFRTFLILPPIILTFLAASSDRSPLQTFLVLIKLVYTFIFLITLIAVVTYFFGTLGSFGDIRAQILRIGPFSVSQVAMGVPPLFRTGGYFGNPNTFASWIAICIPLLFLSFNLNYISRKKFYLYLFIFVLGLAIAGSRAAILIILTAFLVYIFLRSKWVLSKIFIVSFLVLIISAVIAIGVGGSDNVRFSLDLNSRDLIWQLLSKSIWEKPFLGVGFGVSSEAIISLGDASIANYSAHNSYLMIYAEIGVIAGTIAVILLFFPMSFFFYGYLRLKAFHKARLVSISLFIFVLIYVGYALVESSFLRFSTSSFFYFLVLGLTMQKAFWDELREVK